MFALSGITEAVGAMADQFLTNPQALAREYVPDAERAREHAPRESGRDLRAPSSLRPPTLAAIPLCVHLPGHWRLMQGTLIVTP